jgi:hypothetical protein
MPASRTFPHKALNLNRWAYSISCRHAAQGINKACQSFDSRINWYQLGGEFLAKGLGLTLAHLFRGIACPILNQIARCF